MELTDNKEKQKSLDLTEDSPEVEWTYTSFVRELFNGAIPLGFNQSVSTSA